MLGFGGRLLLLLVVAVLASCSGSDWEARNPPEAIPNVTFNSPTYSDAESVWRQARIAVPVRGTTGSIITTNDPYLTVYNLSGTSPGTKWPVLLAFSGCSQTIGDRFMKAMAEQGFIVLQIDGRHRVQEPFICDATKSLSARAAEDMRARQATLSFALSALKAKSWVDLNNIYVLGMWEAAPAVAHLYGRDVRGRILMEWDCAGAPSVYGLRDAESIPTFSVTSANVPALGGGCAAKFGGNRLSQNLFLPSHFPQDILVEPIVFTKLLKFLDLQLFRQN